MRRLLGAAAMALALAGAGCGSGANRAPWNPNGYSSEQIRRMNDNDAAFASCVNGKVHSYNWCVEQSNRTEQQIKEGK